jgi:hypothetical protein
MGNEGLKIVIGADISAVISEMKVASSNVAQFSDVAEKAFDEVAASVGKAAASFNVLSASDAALAKLNASIDAAADAALKAGQKFDSLGGRLPLDDFNKFSSTIDRFKKDIESGFKFKFPSGSIIPPIPASVTESFNKTKIGANQAANALTNVGRVAQDLPFGFVGIQNNLNPLLESFQRLKAETGSSSAAFKALGSSLIGAGGIGLALSVVSAAILIFQNGISGFNSKTKEAKDKADKLKEVLRDISAITSEAAASVEGQVSQVQALASVIGNSNKPYQDRKRALEELKEVNKSYFNDLKLEDAATGKLAATVREYTDALINSAIQKEFVGEIANIAKEVAKQDNVISGARTKLAQAQNVVTQAEDKLAKAIDKRITTESQSTRIITLTDELTAAKGELAKAEGVLGGENSKGTALLVQEALERGQLNKAVEEGLKFKDLNATKTKKEGDELKRQLDLLEKIRDAAKDFQGKLFDLKDIDAATDKLAALEQQVGDLKLKIGIRDAKKAGLPAAEIAKLSDAIKQDTQKRLSEAFEKEALLLEGSPKLKLSHPIKVEIPNNVNFFTTDTGTSNFNINDAVSKATGFDKKIPVITLHEARVLIDGKKVTAQIEGKEQILAELNKQIAGIFEGGFNDALAGIGDALGEALASSDFGSGLKKAAENILGVVGNVMQQLGKAIIAAAIKIKLLKETLEKWAIANPGLAIIAGIGLVAAGVALKNLKFDGPKFADGGIATGPVIGQVGERFRPEVILPLDRLPQLFKQIGGDVGGGMQLIPIVNNEGLYLAMKRGERSAGRKF